MIYINVANNEKNEVLDCLISELANVFLIALGHELIEDNIEKAVNRLSGITIMESEDDVIKINLDNEDIMFCIEDDITGENNYNDGYAFTREATIDYALENVKKKYPDVLIYGTFFVQSGHMGICYYVRSDGDHIVITDEKEDGVYYGELVEEIEYDEEEYLRAVEKKVPYEDFLELFGIDKDDFGKEDYEDLIVDQILFDIVDFMSWDLDTFNLYTNADIGEESFKEGMRKLKEKGLPDPKDYVIE